MINMKEAVPGRHVMSAIGMTEVVVENGKIVSVGEPRLKYCPLFKKFRDMDGITSDVVRENIEFRMQDFGLFCADRVTRAGNFVTFGVSEILNHAIIQGWLEAAVIASDGCGTAVVHDPEVLQGLCGRISGIIETSPIAGVIEAVGEDHVVDPAKTPVDMIKGAALAHSLGYRKFSVTVADPEDAKYLRETYGDGIVIVAVHTSCVSDEGAEMFYRYCDFITCCASKKLREIAFSRDDVVIAGNKVQIVGVTETGKKFVVEKLHSIGREPWDGKTPTDDPEPWL